MIVLRLIKQLPVHQLKVTGEIMNAVRSDMKEHYCSLMCEETQTPCDLCQGQRRKIEEDALRAANKPTLRHNPFEKLLGRSSR